MEKGTDSGLPAEQCHLVAGVPIDLYRLLILLDMYYFDGGGGPVDSLISLAGRLCCSLPSLLSC